MKNASSSLFDLSYRLRIEFENLVKWAPSDDYLIPMKLNLLHPMKDMPDAC
jgi:hypothetical protein